EPSRSPWPRSRFRCFFSALPPPPRSPLFPSTTLFRSHTASQPSPSATESPQLLSNNASFLRSTLTKGQAHPPDSTRRSCKLRRKHQHILGSGQRSPDHTGKESFSPHQLSHPGHAAPDIPEAQFVDTPRSTPPRLHRYPSSTNSDGPPPVPATGVCSTTATPQPHHVDHGQRPRATQRARTAHPAVPGDK